LVDIQVTQARPEAAEQEWWWKEGYSKEFPSHSGDRVLKLSHAGEVRFGNVFFNDVEVSQHVASRAGWERFQLEASPEAELVVEDPWSYEDRYVALANAFTHVIKGSFGFLICDIDNRNVRVPNRTEYYTSGQWAPVGDQLLLSTPRGWECMDLNGSHTASEEGKVNVAEVDLAGWLPSGGLFFYFGTREVDDVGIVTVCSMVDGKTTATLEVDARELVPYDMQRYADLGRDSYALILSPGTRAVGRMLDKWTGARFDRDSSRLELNIMRPTSEVYPIQEWDDSHREVLVCNVEELCVSGTVVP
jgi:hypothetical protein